MSWHIFLLGFVLNSHLSKVLKKFCCFCKRNYFLVFQALVLDRKNWTIQSNRKLLEFRNVTLNGTKEGFLEIEAFRDLGFPTVSELFLYSDKRTVGQPLNFTTNLFQKNFL